MGDVLAQGLCTGGVYALIALGFVIVIKASTIVNLTYGAQILILAYLLRWLVDEAGAPLWAGLLIIGVMGILLALLVERAFVRPVKGQSVLAIMILTLMLGSIVKGISILIWGGRSYAYSFTPSGLLNIGPISVFPAQFYCLIAAIAVFVLLLVVFRYTKLGLGMRVVAANRTVAESLGIKVKRLISVSWVVSGFFSAITAVLLGMVSMLTPEMDGHVLAGGFPALLLGGLFSIPGALVGGVIIGVAEKLGGFYAATFQAVIPWAIMLIILLIRPWGLLGEKFTTRI